MSQAYQTRHDADTILDALPLPTLENIQSTSLENLPATIANGLSKLFIDSGASQYTGVTGPTPNTISNVPENSTLKQGITVLIVIDIFLAIFLIVLGSFTFHIDATCHEAVRVWCMVVFWMLVGYIVVDLSAWMMASTKKSTFSSMAACTLFCTNFVLLLTCYVWGIIALALSNLGSGCDALYWLDLSFVIFFSLLVLAVVCVCCGVCCIVGGVVGSLGQSSVEDNLNPEAQL